MSSQSRVGAIIVAAGASTRMGQLDKIFAPLAGRPLLGHVLDAFEQCPTIDEIVAVLNKENLTQGQELAHKAGWKKVQRLCQGGPRRQDSVKIGLNKLKDCDWVVIHDGARPCVTAVLIEEGLEAARETGAAIAAVPVKDTVKLVNEELMIRATSDRQGLWLAQTPQVFRFGLIAHAHQQAQEATDDAMLLEKLEHPVKVYHGSYENIKITTPDELILAETILTKRCGG